MSEVKLPQSTEVVIIGGGIEGCSIAYHLAKRGITDVVVLERKQLTCGTTWHAAGLVSMLWPTPTLTKLAKYSHELYASLEAETGQATGYRRIGSISLARTEERLEELQRTSSMAAVFGVESEFIDNTKLLEMYPGINTEGVIGALYIEKDGQTNPIDTTMALAKGARSHGVKIFENCKVNHIITEQGTAVGVSSDQGEIRAKTVVLAAGLWSRNLAAEIGIDLPLYACEHFYVVTDEMEGLTKRPVLRDFDKGLYFKEDAGKMLVGWFEKDAIGCSMDKISEDFCFDQFEVDMDHIEPNLIGGMETFPEFGVACGMNSKGIGAAGGLGKLMADWIIDGHPSGDVWECDVRRSHPIQRTQVYVESRIPEALGHTYDMHWPFYQYQSARNLMLSPLHQTLLDQGACYGEVGGYERPNWFARNGAPAQYQYSYKRQNWFEFYAEEHRAVRSSLGVFDMSSFGKFEVAGPDAQSSLQYISAADMNVVVGKVVYTQWLDERGGINADLSIVKVSEQCFWVVTGIGSFNRDWWHLKQHLKGNVTLTDISQHYACLSVQGPNSRNALQKISDLDLSAQSFEFSVGCFGLIAGAKVWMQRLSYVGELGWELFVPAEQAVKVFEAIQHAGAEFDICNAGLHALNSLRLEKGFRHWGHDVGAEDNLLQAGLGFVAKPDAGDFIGRHAFIAQKSAGLPDRRLVQFLLNDPEPLLYHNETIVMDGNIVGYLTSGMYSHSLGGAIGMGYINRAGINANTLATAHFEIEIARTRFPATASLKAFYDPKGDRMKI
jgi:glycine cleavage system aminomethyltransferase T/glycine/D-amino acid oxidase-like deaminating enzyme